MALLSVVFSFYNEEEVLPLLISSVRDVLDKTPDEYELVFVNDASTDRSVDAIRDAAQSQFTNSKGRLRLISLSRRFGVEESFLAGIENAKGDPIVLMYSDMQNPPEVIPDMLTHWRNGSEIVHSVRRPNNSESRLKLAAAHIAYRLIAKIADIQIPVDAGDFKLISRNVAQKLLTLSETDPYLRGIIPWIGFAQSEVTYDMAPRAAGKSKVPPFGRKAWIVFLSGITSFSSTPIYITLLVGLFGTLISIATLVVLGIFVWLGYLSNAPLWVSFALLLWATILFSIGWVGIYVSRIYKDVRGRPRYIVARIEELGGTGGPAPYERGC
jgi:glycosyltransferase involved in cell wall biosynthesis